jgi:hypothetical protein
MKGAAMRARLAILTAVASTAIVAGAAFAASAPSHAALVIRHQVRGCHTWSANGGPFRAIQSLTLRRGGWITVTDNDMMPHTLIQTSGPAVRFSKVATPFTGIGKRGPSAPGAMTYMSAATKVPFSRPGVYRFTTKAGEDYMPMKTVGEDNVLHLAVTVS